jgi:hypothetical protein
MPVLHAKMLLIEQALAGVEARTRNVIHISKLRFLASTPIEECVTQQGRVKVQNAASTYML